MPDVPDPTPLRADAQKNRDRILEVAHAALSEDPGASMNVIAKRAGVGAGTLYRHFPTREALILAVYRNEIQRLVDEVPAVLAEHAPLDAFRIWFERLAVYLRVKHGLGDALTSEEARKLIEETFAPVTAAVAQLLEACAEDGSMRPGLNAGDVLQLMGFLWRVTPGEDQVDQAARIMELVIQGLRP
jgi:AcrR family transcriptional regulator